MGRVSVRNPGVGALEIMIRKARILVDAFNSVNVPEEVREGDIILFTHDDADHFDPSKLPDLTGRSVTIIGPPSIVKPLMEAGKAGIGQIRAAYSQNNADPVSVNIGEICIKIISTSHFMGWKPVHNSYMISDGQSCIYITGDSFLTKKIKEVASDMDIVICNLVDEGYITKRDDPRYAIHHHLSYLLNIMSIFKPERVIGVHLIDFEGTVDPTEMKKLINDYGFGEISIPVDRSEILEI